MLVKKKKMCYNISKLREKEQGTIMWALGFVPLVIMYYIYHSQKVKNNQTREEVQVSFDAISQNFSEIFEKLGF